MGDPTRRHPRSFWRNNGLSIVLFAMFLLTLAGHSIASWRNYNDEQRDHQGQEVGWADYVRTGDFGEAVFENWESEFLQMACYVLLTVALFQKGSSESKKHDGTDEVEADPAAHQYDANVPWPVRKGGWALALYRNSLSIAFVLLFLGSFLAHAATGARRYAAEQRAHGIDEEVGVLDYLGTSRFWSESLENWQSEFLAVFSIVVLSIWLRQWGSPESKPVHAPHSHTGGG